MDPKNQNSEQADLLGDKLKPKADERPKAEERTKAELMIAAADPLRPVVDEALNARVSIIEEQLRELKDGAGEKPKKSKMDVSVGAAIERLGDGLLALFSLVAELAFAAGHAKLRDRVLQKKEELEK